MEDAGEDDHSAVGVEPGVEDQRLQAALGIAFGRRDALHNGFEDVGHALTGFRADEDCIGGVEADGAFDHFLGAGDVGALQIDFVDDGDYFKAVIDGKVGVGEGLGFDTLGGIDN